MDMGSTTMNMATSTMSMDMPSSTSSMSGMDMSGGMMSMSDMQMTFGSATNTTLYSDMLTPTSVGRYAGLCIFLIFMAAIFRGLFAFKSVLETRWRNHYSHRRLLVAGGKTAGDKTSATLLINGSEELVTVVESATQSSSPWRLSVDLPRALLVMVITGVGYLL